MGIVWCCPRRDPKLTRLIASNAVIAPMPIVESSPPLLFPDAEPFHAAPKTPLTMIEDPPTKDQLAGPASSLAPEEEEEEEEPPVASRAPF
jgi:hypothetical protein